MQKAQQYTLGKNERLKSRKAIGELMECGKSFSLFPFRVTWSRKSTATNQGKLEPLQAAFSVSKKKFKNAIDRNRIKRQTKECYRLQKNDLKEKLLNKSIQIHILIVYVSTELPQHELVKQKVNAVLKKLEKLIDEQVDASA